MKAFTDNKLNVTQNIRVVLHRIENIVGKEENAGYQHFLFSHNVFFKRRFPPVHQKSSLCRKGLKGFLNSVVTSPKFSITSPKFSIND